MRVVAQVETRAVDAILWGLAAASASLTLLLSLGPVPPGSSAFPEADKVFHAIAYFVTTLLCLLAGVWRPGRGPGSLASVSWIVPAAALAGGAVIEIMQGVITSEREPQLVDWLAEVAGVFLAVAAVSALRRRA